MKYVSILSSNEINAVTLASWKLLPLEAKADIVMESDSIHIVTVHDIPRDSTQALVAHSTGYPYQLSTDNA